jgi:hypothetical protein
LTRAIARDNGLPTGAGASGEADCPVAGMVHAPDSLSRNPVPTAIERKPLKQP